MALINCPECSSEISDQAASCPHCGFPMREEPVPGRALRIGREYRSQAEFLGLPLIHIATGIDLETGKMRVARGIIAIGNVAVGVFALGGFAAGVFPLGGLALGVVSLGGVAAGLLSFGGCAIGVFLGVGGVAVGYAAIGGAAAGYYAMGGDAAGKFVIDANQQNPEAIAFFTKWFGQWIIPPGMRPPGP